jgi:hypothetical protein
MKMHRFLTSALDKGEWSASRPGRFITGERAPSTHCIGGWVGPRACLDAGEKSLAPAGNRMPAVQPVASAIQIELSWLLSYIQ